MTSPDPKSPNKDASGEGGGMLPALLAGAGILLVAGLFIFGGDDEEATQAKDQKTATASAHTAGGAKPGIAARQADDASKTSTKPRLNPRIANAIVTEGMSPSPGKPKAEPTSFGSTDEEIAYWEEELRSAENMLEIRQRAADYAPSAEEKIRQNGTAEDLAEFQKRLVVVNDNLEKAKARVTEVEEKLKDLQGG